MYRNNYPLKEGLYDPFYEHDACGVGFVCNIKGERSNKVLKYGITTLNRLAHRGAVGSDPKTGDGAGILIQIPHKFYKKVCDSEGINLPDAGNYGTGLIFFPQDKEERDFCKNVFSEVVKEEGLELLGWRKVPVDNSDIGVTAKKTEPVIEQVFIKKSDNISDILSFERKLYIVRKQIWKKIVESNIKEKTFFYITNISARTVIYKGLLMPHQVENYFLDLKDTDIETAICLVHSRYSTNTFPTWDLAQPFRFIAHNGEINTLRGNINWMHAREGLLKSDLFGDDIEKIKPITVVGLSDSATIDNVFELLSLSGRSLPHVMMMLIPAAWEHNRLMKQKVRDFYLYHATLMEPWDGPAAMAFTDGVRVGAVLDRNGLRPARYIVTNDDFVIMASEVGVIDIPPKNISYSGRLEPGKIFFIDTAEGRIVNDEEIKDSMASSKPYGEWVSKNLVDLETLPKSKKTAKNKIDVLKLMNAFGYTREDLKFILKPMAEDGKEPIGAMGNDTPHSVLSKNNHLLFNYFKQLFAQVTNPAIDPIREEVVMSLHCYIGPEKNILEETPEHAHRLLVKHPILTDENLEKIRKINVKGFKSKNISILFNVNDKNDFKNSLDRICKEAENAIKEGYSFIILTDRGVDKDNAALPSLLATGAVHQHLVKKSLRTQIGIIVESGEPRETHHLALLFGYGADAINPYSVFDTLEYMIDEEILTIPYKKAEKNYIKAAEKGILKILSKMGISTLQSYRGAQIFEALGVAEEVIDKCFTGTTSRIGGVGFEEIAEETILRHKEAFKEDKIDMPYLPTGGIYQWKRDGEYHLWNPESIAAIHQAVRRENYEKYKEFAEIINNQSKQPTTLRALLKFKEGKGIPIEEVEPVESIVKRFVTGAMSFGSISKETHETIAIAMNRLGGMSNTGEGGEDPARFQPLPNGDSKRSAVKQVASGRFGVSTNYLVNSDEIQIKIAQGAKPGEGGQLPGHKVSTTIAKTRYTTRGVTLISPPPHHDIYSIEDLAQLIFDLKNVNPGARISVKLVSEIGVGTVAAGVAKGHADMILISGGDGGTGASPRSSIRHAGLPWELGLAETHQTLVLNDLRSRVRLQTDGQMRTGKDVVIAALLGAEEYGFGTAALIIMGCVMLRHCNLNNCSVGIATQNELLRRRFSGRPEYLVNYFKFVAQEVREIMAKLGIRRVDDLIGRTDLVELNYDIIPWKAKKIDFSRILYKPEVPDTIKIKKSIEQDHNIDDILDRKLIEKSKIALEEERQVNFEMEIKNVNRTTGAMLSGEVCKRYGESGLPNDTIHIKFKGEAGQSFGAWLASGVTFELEGLANDYVGKGMSGGKLIIYPYKEVGKRLDDNIIIGNTTFYGAISGEAYIRGVAGERFCIRNSGLYAVIEGVGDHGCEYMTGGRVVVLGRTGRNFAAGMSGGIAYVYDEDGNFEKKCNLEMVDLEELSDEDVETVINLMINHQRYTGSVKAKRILNNFSNERKKFIKVMPIEYKRILSNINVEKNLDLLEVLDG